MDREPVWRCAECRADFSHSFWLNRSVAAHIIVFVAIKVRPLAVQPVSFVRFVVFARFEFRVHLGLERSFHVFDLALRDQTVARKAFCVERQGCLLSFDFLVHHRVGEHGLVALVVTKTTVAEDIDHHVFVELLAELCRHLCRVYNRFGVVTVDVENRSLNDKRVVGWVWRRS